MYAEAGGPLDFVQLGVVGAGVGAVVAGLPARVEDRIEIELPGGARIGVGEGVNGETLRTVLLALKAAM